HQAGGPRSVSQGGQDDRQLLAGRGQAAEDRMSETALRVLLIEDNAADARLLREMLKRPAKPPPQVTCCETMQEAEARLGGEAVDVVLLDLGLPDAGGLEAVHRAQAAAPRVPLVVLTGL